MLTAQQLAAIAESSDEDHIRDMAEELLAARAVIAVARAYPGSLFSEVLSEYGEAIS